MRYFIHFSYDGTNYHGWQRQPNGSSVQETIEHALSLLLPGPVETTGAGRTDTGVHASHMVAHFDSDAEIDCKQIAYRLNRIVPRDICIQKIEPVGQQMHARFSATKRTYRYFIHTRKDPFLRHYSCELHYNLDFDLMNEAAHYLMQQTDFAAFCKAHSDAKTTVCHLTHSEWHRNGDHSWYYEVSANRFLRNMVRALVGTLIEVGRHRLSLEDLKRVVESGNRQQAGESMPANALFLVEVEYGGNENEK